jgi:hypothetical protein
VCVLAMDKFFAPLRVHTQRLLIGRPRECCAPEMIFNLKREYMMAERAMPYVMVCMHVGMRRAER